jgi:hypothetical protein
MTDPASAKAMAAESLPGSSDEGRAIPPANQPGHHPVKEQDKPDFPPSHSRAQVSDSDQRGGSRNGEAGIASRMRTGKAHIVVEPRPDGRWARQKNGASRAASLHSTQAAAERVARAQAKRERTELVVKDRDGRIERRDSFGADPSTRKG